MNAQALGPLVANGITVSQMPPGEINSYRVATIDAGGDHFTREEMTAYARLFAAAPELLEALQAAYPILLYRHQHGDCTCHEKPCPISDVTDALLKATGKAGAA